MTYLHHLLEGKANTYIMDHRGTGRSTILDCVSAQATTTGSPFGSEIDLSEVAACAQDLKYKYGDLSSFSMTTAATDYCDVHLRVYERQEYNCLRYELRNCAGRTAHALEEPDGDRLCLGQYFDDLCSTR